MPERWIKLRLHRKHRKVIAISLALEVTPAEALALAIDWLRLLDSDPTMAKHAFQPAEIAAMLDSDKDVAAAFTGRSVQWLTPSGDGLLRIKDVRKWISERHLSRERVTRHRRKKNALEESRSEAEETRPPPTSSKAISSKSLGSASNSVELQAEVIRATDALGISDNNRRQFINYVLNTPNGFQILRRILTNANEQGIVADARAKYVFKAMKSEATAWMKSKTSPPTTGQR